MLEPFDVGIVMLPPYDPMVGEPEMEGRLAE
jgi:hypothetical protein